MSVAIDNDRLGQPERGLTRMGFAFISASLGILPGAANAFLSNTGQPESGLS